MENQRFFHRVIAKKVDIATLRSKLNVSIPASLKQSIDVDFCLPKPCSLCWPQLENIVPEATCNGEPRSLYENIYLKNVTVDRFGY